MQSYLKFNCYAVDVDWSANSDFPIFKKYGVMNSGLLNAKRYNQTIFDALAAMKVILLLLTCGPWRT